MRVLSCLVCLAKCQGQPQLPLGLSHRCITHVVSSEGGALLVT